MAEEEEHGKRHTTQQEVDMDVLVHLDEVNWAGVTGRV
jgi:hypothetical protein